NLHSKIIEVLNISLFAGQDTLIFREFHISRRFYYAGSFHAAPFYADPLGMNFPGRCTWLTFAGGLFLSSCCISRLIAVFAISSIGCCTTVMPGGYKRKIS